MPPGPLGAVLRKSDEILLHRIGVRTMDNWTRRSILVGLLTSAGISTTRGISRQAAKKPMPITAFRTPYKYGKWVLESSRKPGAFDEQAVDCPFVFSANDRFYMTFIGFDGIGYQTGLAESHDLIHWKRLGLILGRDPSDPITRYNIAMLSILRDDALTSTATLKRVNGAFVGAWHAYPESGYEAGAAVIGLARSDDLTQWRRSEPVLRPEEGAAWEQGGLYKPYLTKSDDTYYLFYNAKNSKGANWTEQIGVATSSDLKTWTRHKGNPIVPAGPPGSWDEHFASDPCVMRYGTSWVVYYYGLSSDGHARELVAVADNPLGPFRKIPEVLIDTGPPGSIDETHAHKASIITSDGVLYHFYCAVRAQGDQEFRGISVARSRPWP